MARLSLFQKFDADAISSCELTFSMLQKQLISMGKLLRDAPSTLTHILPFVFDFSNAVLQQASAAAPDHIEDSALCPFPASLVVQHLGILRRLIPHLPSHDLREPFHVNQIYARTNCSLPALQTPMTDAQIKLCDKVPQWTQECTSLLVNKFIPMSSKDLEIWQEHVPPHFLYHF